MKLQLPKPIKISMTCYGFNSLKKNSAVTITQISEDEALADLSKYKEIRVANFKYKPGASKPIVYLLGYRKYNDQLPKLDISIDFKELLEMEKVYL